MNVNVRVGIAKSFAQDRRTQNKSGNCNMGEYVNWNRAERRLKNQKRGRKTNGPPGVGGISINCLGDIEFPRTSCGVGVGRRVSIIGSKSIHNAEHRRRGGRIIGCHRKFLKLTMKPNEPATPKCASEASGMQREMALFQKRHRKYIRKKRDNPQLQRIGWSVPGNSR